MPPPRSDFDREMMVLEGEIKRLEAEYNMFFAGRLPRLPWETRARVEALVKRYDRMSIQNTADRFRFNTVQSRYAMFCELWERHLKNQEQGRGRVGGRAAATGSPTPAANAPRPAEPVRDPEPMAARPPAADREVHVASLRDPAVQADRVTELYDRLAEAKREAGEPPVPFDRVAALVRAQIEKYKGVGQDVAFRVALKDGKVSLTVTSIKED